MIYFLLKLRTCFQVADFRLQNSDPSDENLFKLLQICNLKSAICKLIISWVSISLPRPSNHSTTFVPTQKGSQKVGLGT